VQGELDAPLVADLGHGERVSELSEDEDDEERASGEAGGRR